MTAAHSFHPSGPSHPRPRLAGLLAAAILVVAGCGEPAPPSAAKGAPAKPVSKAVAPAKGPSKELRVVQRSLAAMGTLFEITVAPSGEDEAVDEAIEEAFAEVRRVEDLMTVWRPGAPLVRVNDAAGGPPVPVPDELLALMEEARRISERTNGKFDVSFAGVGSLWDFKAEHPVVPPREEIERLKGLVDFRSILIDRAKGTLGLARKGMRVGLGAIAKGYGVDKASAVLRSRGYENFIVYGGGDLFVSGSKGGHPWKVGIQDPRDRARNFGSVELRDSQAIVTSGDYEKFFIAGGKRYHHIIDPATGYPAEGTVSVTVIAPSATLADGLATGLFVIGVEKAMALVEADPDLEALIVDDALKVHVSSGLKGTISLRPIGG